MFVKTFIEKYYFENVRPHLQTLISINYFRVDSKCVFKNSIGVSFYLGTLSLRCNDENDVKLNNVQHNKHPQPNDINFTVGLVSRG